MEKERRCRRRRTIVTILVDRPNPIGLHRVVGDCVDTGLLSAERVVVARQIGVSETTVRSVAERFVETEGDVEATITRKRRASPPGRRRSPARSRPG